MSTKGATEMSSHEFAILDAGSRRQSAARLDSAAALLDNAFSFSLCFVLRAFAFLAFFVSLFCLHICLFICLLALFGVLLLPWLGVWLVADELGASSERASKPSNPTNKPRLAKPGSAKPKQTKPETNAIQRSSNDKKEKANKQTNKQTNKHTNKQANT
jgi:hypothetical protein